MRDPLISAADRLRAALRTQELGEALMRARVARRDLELCGGHPDSTPAAGGTCEQPGCRRAVRYVLASVRPLARHERLTSLCLRCCARRVRRRLRTDSVRWSVGDPVYRGGASC